MSEMYRIRVAWSGTPVVGPGVSVFYADSTTTGGWPAALMTLFNVLKSYVPTGVTWTIPSGADVINVETGELTGAVTFTGGGTVASAGGAVDYKPGVGARLRWATNGVVGGRKVTGTTFLVPLTSQEYPNGVIQSGTRAAVATAMAAYIADASFEGDIWSKPVEEDLAHDPPIAHRDGVKNAITGGSMATGETWLRSRRV